PTKPDSYWRKRFRRSNMIRHHYIIHPLLNFTKDSKNASTKNLVNPHINYTHFELDEELVANSPRRINFWECNMAQMFVELYEEATRIVEESTSEIFTINKIYTNKSLDGDNEFKEDNDIKKQCYLDEAYELFKTIN